MVVVAAIVPWTCAGEAPSPRDGVVVQAVERPWLLRWYLREEFRALLQGAGLETRTVLGDDGKPAAEDAPAFVFTALRPSDSV